MFPIRRISVFSNGSYLVENIQTPIDNIQTPIKAPTIGTFLYYGDFFIYIVHDDLSLGYARTLTEKIQIAMTNEIFVPRRWYFREDVQEWRVDRFSKISFWPEDLKYGWPEYFFSGMTPRQHDLFNQTGFGWRDAKANAVIMFFAKLFSRMFKKSVMNIRPEGVNIYNFLLTGGSILKKVGTWREYTLFACQDTNNPPKDVNYESSPINWFKQGVCGHNAEKQSYYGKVNPIQGDLFIPTACPNGIAAILTKQTREIPKVPFSTILDKVMPVTFVELCFRNSEVLGKTDKEEWYYILQQISNNGNQADFVLHIPSNDWPAVLPISRVFWQKS